MSHIRKAVQKTYFVQSQKLDQRERVCACDIKNQESKPQHNINSQKGHVLPAMFNELEFLSCEEASRSQHSWRDEIFGVNTSHWAFKFKFLSEQCAHNKDTPPKIAIEVWQGQSSSLYAGSCASLSYFLQECSGEFVCSSRACLRAYVHAWDHATRKSSRCGRVKHEEE